MCEQSLYFVIHLYPVILVGVFCCVLSNLPQYPGVASGALVLLVGRESVSAGPQFNNCA